MYNVNVILGRILRSLVNKKCKEIIFREYGYGRFGKQNLVKCQSYWVLGKRISQQSFECFGFLAVLFRVDQR